MLSVVRHGRTEANRAGLLLGRLDPPLDEVGRAQAEALAAALGPVDRVVTSPLLRAAQTAAAIAGRFGGLGVEVDQRWIELDYGDWDGRPADDVPVEAWERWRADLDFVPPGGESLRQLGHRVRAACDRLAADAADAHVVVVTHVSPVKAAAAWAMGVGDEITWRTYVAPASITRVAMGRRGPSLHQFNRTEHLVGTGPQAD